MKSIINVSNRLPISIKDDTIERSSGGLAAAMEGLDESFMLKWVGWAGGTIESIEKRQQLSQEVVERFNYYPIFLTPDDVNTYYDGFANSSLWPLLHYMTTYSRYDCRWYGAYERVNRIFAKKVLSVASDNDIIWVHDYHLMLLPAMLKEQMPEAKIGFFLHTPFPSSEIFRCHPNREEILKGLLGADLIGFQTFGYLRHFRSTVLRVLGIESEMNVITMGRHETALGVYPIGINAKKFQQELQTAAYMKQLAEFQRAHEGKKVVLSVERLDYTKGIPRRLEAIEQFLEQRLLQENIVFIFISVPSREDVDAYQNLIDEVRGRIGQINGKYSTIKNAPIHFIHQSVDFSQLCALYSLADICVVTPLIDGMNLVAKEYIACQDQNDGVLVLSEFAGAAQELPHALILNPYDPQKIVSCLNQALEMPLEEKEDRMKKMKSRVIKYDATHWAKTFTTDLADQSVSLDMASDIKRISLEDVSGLISAEKIGLFLDYDGTLAEIRKRPADAYPRASLMELFNRLQAAPGVDVYLISGRNREDMTRWFGSYPFTLISEHGYFYRAAHSEAWRILNEKANLVWKEEVFEILQHYAGMTPGSAVEVKVSSLVWHYRESDPEFGRWKAMQLAAELHGVLTNLPVEIHHGKKIVEVCSIQVNKGLAMQHFISENSYDMSMCAGDDETDESMFRNQSHNLISLKVGEGETAAMYRCPDPQAFRDFVSALLESRLKSR